jgi:hypothetical protein
MTGLVIGTLDQWHNRPMIYLAGDLGIEIDFGADKPGAIFQRKEKGHWQRRKSLKMNQGITYG